MIEFTSLKVPSVRNIWIIATTGIVKTAEPLKIPPNIFAHNG